MAERKHHVHSNGNQNELQNWSQQKTTTGPTFDGQLVLRTDLNKLEYQSNGTDILVATESYVAQQVAALGQLQNGFDASSGALPTAANKVSGDTTQILKGDYWYVSTAGTISGIEGDDVLSVGDVLIYLGGGATTAANWLGVNRNLNDGSISSGAAQSETQTVALVANTDLTVTAATVVNIRSVQTYNSTDEEILLQVKRGTNPNQIILTSNQSLTGVRVDLVG
jgi:hypothetical protein